MDSGERRILLTELQVQCLMREMHVHHKIKLPSIPATECTPMETLRLMSRQEYDQMVKKLKKYNRQTLKSEQKILQFQAAKSAKLKEKMLFICVDIESYERNHDVVTELGYSTYETATGLQKTYHFIVKEYQHLRNGTFVVDRRDSFQHGTSEKWPLKDIAAHFRDLITDHFPNMALIGHNISQDIAYLGKMGIQLPKELQIFDTQEMDAVLIQQPNGRGLVTVCDALGVQLGLMHNAGNDAHCTMLVFLAQVLQPLPDREDMDSDSCMTTDTDMSMSEVYSDNPTIKRQRLNTLPSGLVYSMDVMQPTRPGNHQ